MAVFGESVSALNSAISKREEFINKTHSGPQPRKNTGMINTRGITPELPKTMKKLVSVPLIPVAKRSGQLLSKEI